MADGSIVDLTLVIVHNTLINRYLFSMYQQHGHSL
jgi:hypothetical protein